MICSHCNREIPDGSTFCGFCGNKTELAGNVAEEVTEAAGEAEVLANEAVQSYNDVSESVSEAADQAAFNGVPQSVSEAADQAAFNGIPQPVSEAADQAAYNDIPQPSAEAGAWAANAANQIGDGFSPMGGAADQMGQTGYAQPGYAQPGMADINAMGQAAAAGNTAGGKAFNIAALLKNKLFLICVGAVVLLVVLIIIIANAAASSGTAKNPVKGSYFGGYYDGEYILLYNGTEVKGADFSRYVNQIGKSLDGTKALVVDDSELFLLDSGKVTSITDDLYRGEAVMSDSGTVVYISDGSLYVYSGSKSKEIAELDDPSRCSYAVSPDGGTVVFSEYTYEDEYWESGRKFKYVNAWDGKKVIDLDEKFDPYYVSNGGKIIYGKDASGKFTYLKNMKPGSAEKLKNVYDMYPVSADHSKIMYTVDGTTYYFDASRKDPVKVSAKSFDIIMPGGYEGYPKDLKSFYAETSNGIYHFFLKGDSYESEKMISSVDEYMLSADGKTLICRDDDEIFKISVSNPDKKIDIADEVLDSYYYTSLSCDPSLKYVYYLDEDYELRYASKQGKKIGTDIDDFYVNEAGVCVFLTDDGDLYYSSKGGDKVKVSGISDVEGMAFENNIFYVGTDDAIYVSTDGKKFKKAYDY